MKETYEFLNEKTFFVATMNGDKPSNRPFGATLLFDNKIYIVTNKQKSVSKQIAANNQVCIVAQNNRDWIRINCQLMDDSDNVEVKKVMLNEFIWMKDLGYSLDNPDFQIFYMANADAKVYDVAGKEKEAFQF